MFQSEGAKEMDIKVTVDYPNGEVKEFIEPINAILSVNEISEYLKKKYYNASAIEWHEYDKYWDH